MKEYLDLLRRQFNDRVHFSEKRPGIYQRIAPFYHEDGDMIEIYLDNPKGDGKIRVTTILCLEFQKAKIPHKSIVVHEDFESLARKDRKRITSAADKQFVDLEDFKAHGEEFILRDAA
jgi:hypothetical protein